MATYPPIPTNPHYLEFPPPQQQHQFHSPYYGGLYPTEPQFQQQQHQHQPLLGSEGEEVRTLFIAGLPQDVKYREVYNLFREFPGYVSCQLKQSGKGSSQAYAFSVFADQQSALVAMHALNGMDFDPETGSVLHIELAKANSRSKRLRTDDGGSISFDKRIRSFNSLSGALHDAGVGGTMHMPGMSNSGYSNTIGLQFTHSVGGMMEPTVAVQNSVSGLSTSRASTYAPSGNPPCPTIFIANLGPTCSEEELTHVLTRYPGFLKLKMQIRGGLPVAFVDFQDTACSTQALNQLQNTTLYSSDRCGMRVEFAKARMGLPKRERRA